MRRNGGEETIPVEALSVGDVFLVKPGQSMATDGEVVAGESTVNQAPVTGESVPVYKHIGDPVFAGSLNEEGALEVKATRTFADNTVSRIIHMVEEAQELEGAEPALYRALWRALQSGRAARRHTVGGHPGDGHWIVGAVGGTRHRIRGGGGPVCPGDLHSHHARGDAGDRCPYGRVDQR